MNDKKKSTKKSGKSYTNKKDYSKKSEDTRVEYGKNEGNHPSWYKVNDQLAKDTASIPFGYALGARKGHGPYGDKFNNYAIAGICRINYMPTYGHMESITAPLNIAARNIYTNLKSVNSRAKSYDASDIALYLISIDNLISFHEFIKRLYGLMNTASVTNRYYARAAVEAAGGDFEDLLNHITDLRAYINQFALRISTMPLPNEMSIFSRHAWLPSHAWYDSANPTKSQSYMFVPTGFWKYKLDDDYAGAVEFIELPGVEGKQALTFAQIKEYGEDMLSRILYGYGEEDFNIMAGDILYAYGNDKLYRATTIAETYAVVPTYDEWTCDQINNARAFGRNLTEDSKLIVQSADKSHLRHVLTIETPAIGDVEGTYPWNDAVMDQYVNIMDTDTSSDHVMVATRLLNIPVAVEDVATSARSFQFLAIASEYVCDYVLYYYATLSGKASDWQLYKSDLLKTVNVVVAPDKVNVSAGVPGITGIKVSRILEEFRGTIDTMMQLSCFDRHPIMYHATCVFDGRASGEGEVEYSPYDVFIENKYMPHAFIDLNNYSLISYETLKQMNDTILLAMFGIDEFGKQISLK